MIEPRSTASGSDLVSHALAASPDHSKSLYCVAKLISWHDKLLQTDSRFAAARQTLDENPPQEYRKHRILPILSRIYIFPLSRYQYNWQTPGKRRGLSRSFEKVQCELGSEESPYCVLLGFPAGITNQPVSATSRLLPVLTPRNHRKPNS